MSPIVPTIEVEELKNVMDSNKGYTLLDVRTPGEYERAKLKGSINIPVEEISSRIMEEIPNTSTTVYVYCLSGSRSVHAVAEMMALGYTNVYDVSHGLLAWRAKGFTV